MNTARAILPAFVRIERTSTGPRLWVCGRRWHHGFVGCVCIGVGVALVLSDLPDIADWWPKPAAPRPRPALARVQGIRPAPLGGMA